MTASQLAIFDLPEPSVPAPSRVPGVRVGTSGYSFRDWVGPFYPAGIPSARHLEYYASRFDCLELNVTFYRVPDVKLIAGLERRTPPGFAFVVKLHRSVTHERSRDPAIDAAFLEAVKPLRDAGKLHGFLAQFPQSFANTPPNRSLVAALRDRFPEDDLFVEFRRRDWAEVPVFEFLETMRLGWVCVDEPALPGLVPPLALATTETAYVRLHGRNGRDWYGGAARGADRYDYSYTETELHEWVEKTRHLSSAAKRTFVFFNNCHSGQAPANARTFQGLLAL